MNDMQAVELVSLHADALKDGRDIGNDLAETISPPARRAALAGLFSLTSKLKSVLTLVSVRPRFAAELRQQLIRHAQADIRLRKENREKQLLWFAIGVGSVVYVIGVFAASVRFAWWAIGLAALAFGWRKRPMLARAHQPARG